MLTTSISLSCEQARLWRNHGRQIRKYIVQALRITMQNSEIRRNMTRQYNSRIGNYIIVTTRLTPAEYDTLHFVAYSQRISVSLLISKIIILWLQKDPRINTSGALSNYEIFPIAWQTGGGIVTEALIFYDKLKSNLDRAELQPVLC